MTSIGAPTPGETPSAPVTPDFDEPTVTPLPLCAPDAPFDEPTVGGTSDGAALAKPGTMPLAAAGGTFFDGVPCAAVGILFTAVDADGVAERGAGTPVAVAEDAAAAAISSSANKPLSISADISDA
jgi:hypothetical protein